MKQITMIPLKTPIIQPGDSVAAILYKVIRDLKVHIDNRDVMVIADKIVGTAEGRVIKLETIVASDKAKELAAKYQMDPRVVEAVLQEADEVFGGVKGVLLTIKHDTLIANAGIDLSNVPFGYIVLFPKDPWKSAQGIKEFLERKFNKKIAVILGDSRVQPLRRGTIGVALAVAGMDPVEDYRGREDLFGRKLQITFRAVADDLVSAAELIMGEAKEQIPAVLIKGMNIHLTEKPTRNMAIDKKECLFMNSLSTN